MELGMFEYSKARVFAKEALNHRAVRQDLISSNIANIDTPFYKPKDINFEQMLAKKAKDAFGNKKPDLELAKTSGHHMNKYESMDSSKATLFFRDGHLARNDGNSVDLDVEMGELSKNDVMYKALINGLKKNSAIMRTVLESSSKL
ncbi:MAG: flagellar basal body rod protein FlgB [Campylobacterales bacterium]